MKTAFASVMLATVVTSGALAGSNYVSQVMIDAIVDCNFMFLESANPDVQKARAEYLAGFTLLFDNSCGFLSPEGTRKVSVAIETFAANGGQPGENARAFISDGFRDAKEFLAQNGCESFKANGAKVTLRGVWAQTTDAAATPNIREAGG